jgi:hypothetical protein
MQEAEKVIMGSPDGYVPTPLFKIGENEGAVFLAACTGSTIGTDTPVIDLGQRPFGKRPFVRDIFPE